MRIKIFRGRSRNNGKQNNSDDNINIKSGCIGNTGKQNIGDRNAGSCNSGNENSGSHNQGNYNSGNYNRGYGNSDERNSGWRNSGRRNMGDRNSGCGNVGDKNTGHDNIGSWNTGRRNRGNSNSGMFNRCSHSNGFFCTTEPTVRMFNKDTNLTYDDFSRSEWHRVLNFGLFRLTEWVAPITMPTRIAATVSATDPEIALPNLMLRNSDRCFLHRKILYM